MVRHYEKDCGNGPKTLSFPETFEPRFRSVRKLFRKYNYTRRVGRLWQSKIVTAQFSEF